MASLESTIDGNAAMEDTSQRGRSRNPLSAITNQGKLAPSFVSKTAADVSAPSCNLEEEVTSLLGDGYGASIQEEQGMPNKADRVPWRNHKSRHPSKHLQARYCGVTHNMCTIIGRVQVFSM